MLDRTLPASLCGEGGEGESSFWRQRRLDGILPLMVRQRGTAHRRPLDDLPPSPANYYGSSPLTNSKPGQRDILAAEPLSGSVAVPTTTGG